VAETLTRLGVTMALRRGGFAPALFTAVAAGEALGLSTAAAAAGNELIARVHHPVTDLAFELLWRD
jgi:hypothetical protein